MTKKELKKEINQLQYRLEVQFEKFNSLTNYLGLELKKEAYIGKYLEDGIGCFLGDNSVDVIKYKWVVNKISNIKI